MKKVKYLAMLLAAGMFAACSDNLEDTGAGNAGGTTPATGEGYVKVAINMPTTSGNVSRSSEGDGTGTTTDVTLDNGIANEYNVENGIIAFFKTTSSTSGESDATFVKAYKLDLGEAANGPDPQVTTRYSVVTEAPQVGTGEQLYALVILNYDGTVVNFAESNSTLTIGGTAITTNSKLEDFQKKIATFGEESSQTTVNVNTFTGSSANQFTMTNAPLTDDAGDDNFAATAKAYTLVPVTVYDTEALAAAADPAAIYVERVVAKVTLTGFEYKDNKYTKTVTGSNDAIELKGWALNVTNKSTKLVRDVSEFTSSGWLANTNNNSIKRFAGTVAIAADFNVTSGEIPVTSFYRIYWAKDCNYGTGDTYSSEEFNIYSSTSEPSWNPNTADNPTSASGTVIDEHALYCLENTMDYDHQDQNETTGVLIKTKYLPQFSGQSSPTEQDFFICGTSSTKYPKDNTTGSSAMTFLSYVKTQASLSSDIYIQTTAQGGIYDSLEDIKTLFTNDSNGGTSTMSDNDYSAIWNAIGRISYYKNSDCYYYATLIRHFQDSEGVTWSVTNPKYTLTHLGRYGVVRNNWYEINITGISGPGDPSIIEPGDEDDDKKEGYVRAEINVLSWAKRSQDVDL